jgi:hypothetical protein
MDKSEAIQRRTISLWPEAGRALGLGKNATYTAAMRGDIPGVFRIGSRWLVAREAFDQALRQGPATRPMVQA